MNVLEKKLVFSEFSKKIIYLDERKDVIVIELNKNEINGFEKY
jgi:hypothetical protein